MDKSVLYDFSYGMYIIGAAEENRYVGCVVNTAVQITSQFPTVAISLNKDNYTYSVIHKTKKFSISILSEETRSEVIGIFGFQSSKDNNKYETIHHAIEHGLPVIQENCCGTLFCDVITEQDMGTHVVLLARLTDTLRSGAYTPMTYSYYHNVIKGKAPKNAPTYQAEAASSDLSQPKLAYVCSICGYIYEGDINSEPDSYVCPVCKASKDKFVKV